MSLGRKPGIPTSEGGPATVVFLVAAVDATAAEILAADYVCDGVADEVQINAAITALPTNGGIVQLSTGTFTVSAAIAMNKNGTTLRGGGFHHRGTIVTPTHIRRAGGVAANCLSVTSIVASRVEGIRFSLDSGQTASTLFINAANPLVLRDCRIDVSTNAFSNTQRAVGFSGDNLEIRDCRILAAASCIFAQSTPDNLWIDNVSVESTQSTSEAAIHVQSSAGSPGDLTRRSWLRLTNLRCEATIWRVLTLKELGRALVSGCMFTDHELTAIYVEDCASVQINDCNLGGDISSTEPAMVLDGCTYVSVDHVRVDDTGEDGIVLLDSSDCSVRNCDIIGAGQATDNTYAGIKLDGDSNRNNVQGNTVRYAGANHTAYGIRIDDATCDDNYVSNNDLLNSGDTANYSDAGTGTINAAGNRV